MTNGVFKTAEVWESPEGIEYQVLYVHQNGVDLPVAKLCRVNGTFRNVVTSRWHNDTNGWTLVRSAMETGAES